MILIVMDMCIVSQFYENNHGFNIIYFVSDPDQWTCIPLLVKIYKLLVNELSNICDQGLDNQDEDESTDVRH